MLQGGEGLGNTYSDSCVVYISDSVIPAVLVAVLRSLKKDTSKIQ